MALVTVNFFSKYLLRTVTFQAILPLDKVNLHGAQVEDTNSSKPLKTLYLLHGVFGNYTDWVSGTRIQRWAQDRNLAVIMPSGDNHFYVDCVSTGEEYGKFIGEELVEFTRRMFPLSTKREDTFIGGLSMGGYGAIRNGLKYHDTFGRICALSAGFQDKEDALPPESEKNPIYTSRRSFFEAINGDLSKMKGSDRDCKALVSRLRAEGAEIPEFYVCCGTEDFLLEKNRDYVSFLKDNEVKVTYEEGPGAHEWDFWDRYIEKIVKWLAPETQKSMGSGNVPVGRK